MATRRELEQRTVRDLADLARRSGIEGWKGLRKKQLVEAILRWGRRKAAARRRSEEAPRPDRGAEGESRPSTSSRVRKAERARGAPPAVKRAKGTNGAGGARRPKRKRKEGAPPASKGTERATGGGPVKRAKGGRSAKSAKRAPGEKTAPPPKRAKKRNGAGTVKGAKGGRSAKIAKSAKRARGEAIAPAAKGAGSAKRARGEAIAPAAKGAGSAKRPRGEAIAPAAKGAGSAKREKARPVDSAGRAAAPPDERPEAPSGRSGRAPAPLHGRGGALHRPPSHPGAAQRPSVRPAERRITTEDDRLVLLPVEPYWAHAYWVLSAATFARMTRRCRRSGGRLVLRFRFVSTVEFNDRRREGFVDVDLISPAGNYYLNLWSGGQALSARIGILGRFGRFTPLLEARPIELPRAGESPVFEDLRVPVRGEGDALWRPRSGAAGTGDGEERIAEAAEEAERGLELAGAADLELAGAPDLAFQPAAESFVDARRAGASTERARGGEGAEAPEHGAVRPSGAAVGDHPPAPLGEPLAAPWSEHEGWRTELLAMAGEGLGVEAPAVGEVLEYPASAGELSDERIAEISRESAALLAPAAGAAFAPEEARASAEAWPRAGAPSLEAAPREERRPQDI
ncbi:MAG: DUF4912 domain-containing protein, partial [Planctomycetes bacterium]|nr:DUF4912 domain-containing protein [Planctomycetota bacterium]